MLGVELVALGINFENFGSIRAPVPGLLNYLGIYFELGQEVLDTTLAINEQKAILSP